MQTERLDLGSTEHAAHCAVPSIAGGSPADAGASPDRTHRSADDVAGPATVR